MTRRRAKRLAQSNAGATERLADDVHVQRQTVHRRGVSGEPTPVNTLPTVCPMTRTEKWRAVQNRLTAFGHCPWQGKALFTGMVSITIFCDIGHKGCYNYRVNFSPRIAVGRC